MRHEKTLTFGGIAGLLVGGATTWWFRNDLVRAVLTRRSNGEVPESAALPVSSPVCRLTPAQTSGPFFVASPKRSNIREDRSGVPLTLSLRLVEEEGCYPIAGAAVEIWHCDAAGNYSAYPDDISRKPFETLQMVGLDDPNAQVPATAESRFLRGAQVTDAEGLVSFHTILPGWYDPRITHIHVKALHRKQELLTTQLYFPMALCNEIYASHPDYAPHGLCPYDYSNDVVIGAYPDLRGLVLAPSGDVSGLRAEALLTIA